MRQKMKTVCQILAALAIAVAPGAAQNLRKKHRKIWMPS